MNKNQITKQRLKKKKTQSNFRCSNLFITAQDHKCGT